MEHEPKRGDVREDGLVCWGYTWKDKDGNKRYQWLTPERFAEKMANDKERLVRYTTENAEVIRLKQAEKYEKNKEYYKAKSRENHAKNRERNNKRNAEYQKKNTVLKIENGRAVGRKGTLSQTIPKSSKNSANAVATTLSCDSRMPFVDQSVRILEARRLDGRPRLRLSDVHRTSSDLIWRSSSSLA
jgi:hypothetical protein